MPSHNQERQQKQVEADSQSVTEHSVGRWGFVHKPLPVSIETTSVSLGVDLEAASHLASTISMLH